MGQGIEAAVRISTDQIEQLLLERGAYFGSSESQPDSAWERTGTPMTGSVVCAATMPGRWAAPPAPAMMIFSPLARALCANSPISSGVRCAEITCFMYGTSNWSSISHACFMVSQSLADPMITATSGLLSAIKTSEGFT